MSPLPELDRHAGWVGIGMLAATYQDSDWPDLRAAACAVMDGALSGIDDAVMQRRAIRLAGLVAMSLNARAARPTEGR